MMTEQQKSKVAELKATIAATMSMPDGAPRELRAAALALKAELKRSGTTARTLAAAIGVHETTLSRWGRDAAAARPRHRATPKRRDGGFRVVQVGAPAAKPASLVPAAARGIRVAHAPSGLVVDGLDVETLAALLRRLAG